MNKFFKNIFLFTIFSIIAYVISICIYGDLAPNIFKKNLNYKIVSNGYMHSRMNELKSTKNVDLLFLGSSHAYRGFDTRFFSKMGYKNFNLGSSSQTPFQTYLLLKKYLNRLNPKLVIYEVYPETFCSDGVESSLDLIANDKTDLDLIIVAIKQNHIKVYNSLIYDSYREMFNRNSNIVEPKYLNGDTYIRGGFVERKMGYNKTIEKDGSRKWEFNTGQFTYFEKSLSLLRSRKIKLILVQAPLPKALYTKYENNLLFDKKMEKYSTYINFNNDKNLHLNDTLDFYDGDHLNQRGVELFNKELAKKINL